MRVGNVSLLASISSSSTDLKRIQTPHNLFTYFGAGETFTTCWSGCRKAPAGHLAITPKGNSRTLRQSKVLTGKWMGKLLGPRSSTAWMGQTGDTHKHRCFQVGCSRCWQRQARFRKKCYHSRDTDLVRESKRFYCLVILGINDNFFPHGIWTRSFDGFHESF